MSAQLKQFVNRASEVVGAYGNFQTAPANVDAETEALARCELIGQVMDLFIRYCYKQDDNGIFVHLSGNCMIPGGIYTPWGSAGKGQGAPGRAQLTYTERMVVRVWLRAARKSRTIMPVFYYNVPSRRWMVDTVRYKTMDEALAWLQSHRIQPATYVMIAKGINSQRNR